MPTCPTCDQLQRAIDHCISFGLRRVISKRLLDHKLSAHPHKATRLPWEDWPKSSPLIENITERNN